MNSASFLWAAGIEDTFIPHTRPGLRTLDEYELTQHYQLWKQDFDLAAEAGVRYLRWGIPWYRIQPARDRWDWAWVDEALDYLVNVKGITPILDLVHYGTPLWLEESFAHPCYPEHVAEYAAAVVARYRSLVRYYTPLNEPTVNAEYCGRKAEWPPYLHGEAGYVQVLVALAKGIIRTTRAIQTEQPDAVTVQVEALGHTSTQDDSLQEVVALQNARQYLCFDLVTGRVDERHPLREYLLKHSTSETDLAWFGEQAVSFDLLGANFYPWSQSEVKRQPDGSLQQSIVPARGNLIAQIIREAYQRYHLPVMVTETSANADIEGRMQWMDETLQSVRDLRAAGIPVAGYTWFPLFTMVDWAYRTGSGPLQDYLIHLGLYESALDGMGILRRRSTPLVQHFREQMQREMPPIG